MQQSSYVFTIKKPYKYAPHSPPPSISLSSLFLSLCLSFPLNLSISICLSFSLSFAVSLSLPLLVLCPSPPFCLCSFISFSLQLYCCQFISHAFSFTLSFCLAPHHAHFLSLSPSLLYISFSPPPSTPQKKITFFSLFPFFLSNTPYI